MNTLRRTARAPRRKFNGSIGGEGRVSSRYLAAGVVTGAGQTSGYVLVDPPQHSSTNDPGAAVLINYSNYKVTSSKFIYVPAVGTTTTGTIWAAYIDNPEVIYKILNFYTGSQITNIVQNSSNAKAVPVWEPMELSMNRPPRNKSFSVDTSSIISTDQANRATQGIWVWATTAAPLSTTLGTILEEYTCVGENLQPAVFTGV